MLTAAQRRLALVTYRLKGEHIKVGLVSNPGKIILTQRQAGKTTQLCEYIQEQHTEGVLLFCHNQDIAAFIRDHHLKREYFLKCVLLWGKQDPPFFTSDHRPIYGDEILMLGGTMVKAICRDGRFMGAVSSVPSMQFDDEVKRRCILY